MAPEPREPDAGRRPREGGEPPPPGSSPAGDGPDAPGRRRGGSPPRPQRGALVLGLLVALGALLALSARDGDGAGRARPRGQVDLIELDRLLRRNEVAELRFKDLEATAVLRPGDLSGQRASDRLVVAFGSAEGIEQQIELVRELSQPDRPDRITTRVVHEPSSALLTQLVAWFLPTLLLVGLLYFLLFRHMRGPGAPGSLLQFGKSRHRMGADREETVTLADVAGIDEARADVEEIIAFLKDPQKFSRLGGRIPKGVLLVGSPGCGKTLLAKATAGEAGVPFYAVSGSDFVEMFVGVGASRVRDLFEKAKETSPCIVFLDEVDAVGRRRGSGLGGGHDEREQTLNQILVEMDGFDTDKGIIVMAATNRPDILDPALLRPGRFDRQITIDLPDVAGREKILRVHARNKKLALDVDLATLARATPTFSGAELEALLNEGALMAAMADHDAITMRDLEEARDKIRWGRQRRSQRMVERELRATAWHEAGHALVSALVEGSDPVHKVTIVPRGRALGLTMSLPDGDRWSLTRTQVLARICMAFGGRLGEACVTNDLSTGAQNDIEQATELARRMITEWGMSEALGPIQYATGEDTVFLGREINRSRPHSEATLEQIDREVRRVIDEQHERARGLIEAHRPALDRIAALLLERETIDGAQVQALVEGRDPGPSPLAEPGPAGGQAPPPEAAAAASTGAASAELTAGARAGESEGGA